MPCNILSPHAGDFPANIFPTASHLQARRWISSPNERRGPRMGRPIASSQEACSRSCHGKSIVAQHHHRVFPSAMTTRSATRHLYFPSVESSKTSCMHGIVTPWHVSRPRDPPGAVGLSVHLQTQCSHSEACACRLPASRRREVRIASARLCLVVANATVGQAVPAWRYVTRRCLVHDVQYQGTAR